MHFRFLCVVFLPFLACGGILLPLRPRLALSYSLSLFLSMLLRVTITTDAVKRTLACMKADQFVNACLSVIFARARNPPPFKVDHKCINLKMQNELAVWEERRRRKKRTGEEEKRRREGVQKVIEEDSHTHTHMHISWLSVSFVCLASGLQVTLSSLWMSTVEEREWERERESRASFTPARASLSYSLPPFIHLWVCIHNLIERNKQETHPHTCTERVC